jgi:hypothetical protein
MNDDAGKLRESLLSAASQQYVLGEAEERSGRLDAAAVSYRIAANTYRTLVESAEARRDHSLRNLELIEENARRWMAHCPPPWTDAHPLNGDSIRRFVLDEALGDAELEPYFRLLNEGLTDSGVEISSPGGSLQRHLTYLLEQCANGSHGDRYAEALKHPFVRVALEMFFARLLRPRTGDAPPG